MELQISDLRDRLRSGFRSEQFHAIERDDDSVQFLLNKIWRHSGLSISNFNREIIDAWDTRGDTKIFAPQINDIGSPYWIRVQSNKEKEDERNFDPSKYNILAELPYDVFLQTIMNNDIRGKELLSLCVSNPKINQQCNHRDQYLFRRLLQISNSEIDYEQLQSDPNPRETYFESNQTSVWTFGHGYSGQLGFPDRKIRLFPDQIPNFRGIKQISCGQKHTAFIA